MTLHQPIPPVPLSQPAPIYLKQAPLSDSECDVTDAWNERSDPENEEGAIVTAFFEHATDHGQTQATMIGLSIEEDGLTLFYTGYGALAMLGTQAVCWIEQVHGETLQ